ncbi:hypothetical protein BDU57DRAFT_576338 [Ampelomyces quisqualis]|uniref:Lytic polysaccharide monooxygenase n=1 Tax=Ampelomyces quisqualis TaxID=50730 RepID=A0A6A5QKT9_AMPQU|nr:hypothetical protein BDU57DRAFT_576338 [Ampelomyces quisqualis]
MMFSSTSTVLAAMLAMAPLAHAHMTMVNPVPFGSPNNSPLLENGADFPCKSIPYIATKMNDWPVGSVQSLILAGSAVHGGGSCQISVTTDKAPDKASKWKVIHSFEGACPVPPAKGGNYGLDEDLGRGPYNFTIPSELPDGDFVASWSWFNKVGNREMYMNCAAVKVTGGASDKTAFDALPDMAVANIAGQGNCKTQESHDYTFENPGKYVTRNKDAKGPFVPLCGGAPAGGNTGAPGAAPANPGTPSPAPGAPSQAPANQGVPTPSQAAVSSPAGSDKLTSTLRTIVTVSAPSAPGPSSKSNATLPVTAQPSPPTGPQAPVAPSQAPAAPSAAPAPAGAACSPDGSIVCSPDGKQFAMCNWGKAVFQPVAGGTTCTGGKIAKRYDYASTLRTVYN